MSASIKYRNYEFSTNGRPQFGRRVRYESDAPGKPPTRAVVTYQVAHIFTEDSFSDNQARYAALKSALSETEGVLLITDENDTVIINQLVRVEDFDLPPQWGQHMAEVTVSFTCFEEVETTATAASYTPQGGAAITLPNVSAWRESIRADRFSTAVANRRECNGVVSASGKVRADPQLTEAQRRSYLQGVESSLKACADSKHGQLVFASFSQVVRVDSIDTDLKDGSDTLDWSITASYRRFPSGDYAEADYTAVEREDQEKKERVTSVRGVVRADDEVTARAKAEAIRLAYAGGKLQRGSEIEAKLLSGADGEAFTELAFTFDFRESLSGSESWNLTISDKDDLRSGQIVTTYSGKVTASGSVAALAKARSVGSGKYPIMVTSNETVATVTINGTEQFTEVTFSYEYLRKGSRKYAEVQSESDKQAFGVNGTNVTGYAVSDTEANALALARSFKLSGRLLRSEREVTSKVVGPTTEQFNKVDFTYSYHADKSSGSIQYTVRNQTDYKQLQSSLVISGTAWAVSESAADTLINTLVASITGGVLTTDERTSSFDSSGVTAFVSRSFTVSRTTQVDGSASGTFGDNGIIESEVTIETTYSVNQAVITPIPFGVPHVQTDCGVTPGSKVATGTITALTEAACRTWARAKIPSGGYPEPYREAVTQVFKEGSSTNVRCYKMSFTYGKRFTELTF